MEIDDEALDLLNVMWNKSLPAPINPHMASLSVKRDDKEAVYLNIDVWGNTPQAEDSNFHYPIEERGTSKLIL